MKKVEIFPKLASKCHVCHGGGILPGRCGDDELLPCPTCQGKGVIGHQVTKKDTQERPCDNPNCHDGIVEQIEQAADGRQQVVKKNCPVCQGYGVIYRETRQVTTDSEKCPTCEGRGMITAAEMKRRKLECLCPNCHGTGFELEEEPAKNLLKVAVSALVYPVVTLASMSFGFMFKSVKAAITAKSGKGNK
ncbi:MAG: hypothetical protein Q4C56_06620 [Peptococcaceae bacterium]|nr:hypothetical protein [Peptococcaceae bacterium]